MVFVFLSENDKEEVKQEYSDRPREAYIQVMSSGAQHDDMNHSEQN